MYQLRLLVWIWKSVSAGLVAVLLLQTMSAVLLTLALWLPWQVSAAVVTIDTTVSTSLDTNMVAGSQNVFVSDQTGYTFYRDSNGSCVYSKTTNGGDSWGSAVTVDSQTDCIKIVVWYDRWTPGDTAGNYIHIATMDTSLDDLFYNRLDTSNDTLLMGSAPVNATIFTGQSPTFAGTINSHTITKATDGTIYLASNDTSDSYVVYCASNCTNQDDWVEAGPRPQDLADDHNLLMPLAGGNVLLINRDISLDDIRSTVWNGTTWSSWSTLDASAPENSTYDIGMAATLDVNSGDIYLAYISDYNDFVTADHDIRTAVYSGGAWSSMGDVLTNVPGRGLHSLSISYDQNTQDVYVAYIIRDVIGTATSANVYYKRSVNGMTSWETEQGPVNSTSGNLYGPFVNLNSYERLYLTWFDPAPDDRFGNTMADIGPDTVLSSIGTQVSEVRAGETGHYVGGSFVLSAISSRTVSGIKITETGTIDAESNLKNVALYYDLDTTAPYDCVGESYNGSEMQFGITDTDGFSGANGGSAFSGSIVSILPTQTMCVYVVLDVLGGAGDGETINLEVSDPPVDVTVSGTTVYPLNAVALTGVTSVVSPDLTQTHFHWRNDDGDETGATSATGEVEDTPLTAVQKDQTKRLRLQVSNEGSTSTEATLRLEYGLSAPTCSAITNWTTVGTGDQEWNMSPTANLSEGANASNISNASGGTTDENTNFLVANGGLRDESSALSSITLSTTDFIEMEFSIIASTTAMDGGTYCFRVSDSGSALSTYGVYPTATIDADVRVSTLGTAVAVVDIPTSGAYFGGAFSIESNSGAQTVTSIVLAEKGTVNASTSLENLSLYYDIDTAFPYDCASESFNGNETLFGISAQAFSGENGTTTITGSASISDTSTMCVYVLADVNNLARTGETVSFEITSPTTDVVVGSASVAPGNPVTISGSTTLQGGEVRQVHYHWRNDDGNEIDATSATAGLEDQELLEFSPGTPIRLRLAISNEGATTSVPHRFRLEYAPRNTTCELAPVWTDVGLENDDGWDMFNSDFLNNGDNTSNVSIISGGVSDENTTFLSANGGIRDTESITGSTSLSQTEFTELEFSIESTSDTAYNTTYCFRVSNNGTPLHAYDSYPLLTTAKKRDFKTQRGNVVITGTSTTLIAGVHYVAPESPDTAFVRITNSHHTGAGDTVGGGAQNADDITAYIYEPDNISSQITFGRLATVSDTYVDWEIIEFVGAPGTDNQMIVRDVGMITLPATSLTTTGPTVAVTADEDVVVFITGIRNRNTSRNYYAGQVSTAWNSDTNQPVFTRAATGNAIVDVSYAVVEYVGENWKIQRVENTYTSAGVTEIQPITAVNSLERTFLHVQKRLGATTNVVHFGHTVWLSSIGAISFELESGASTAVEQTSVAWVIENLQAGPNAMKIQRLSGNTLNGSEPLLLPVALVELDAVNNSSVFANSRAGGVNTNYPRPVMGARIASTTALSLWRSDTGSLLTYRVEVVEWPVADLALRQNYYRFYSDNDQLTPADPWPPGPANLGENTIITDDDDPLGAGEYLRLRMTLRVANANLPAGFQTLQLQSGKRLTTCTAVSTWEDVGLPNSASAWRGVAGVGTTDGSVLSTNPPTGGDLLLSVADVAGVLVHQNPSTVNQYKVFDGQDVEFDWYLEQNSADPESTYCFRMVRAGGELLEGYFHYPQIRTASFEPVVQNWRWYSDYANETPVSPLTGENVAPTNIDIGTDLALRVTVAEQAGVVGNDVKFKLQFSDDISFANPIDVVASSSCLENSLWCYIDSGIADNLTISASTLSDAESCVSGTGNGCGTHNSSATYQLGHLHGATRAQEYSFTITQAGARTSAVYYFRLVSVSSGKIVPLQTSAVYPSLQTGNSSLTFSVSGLPDGVTTADVVTDVASTPLSVGFGTVPFNTDLVSAQRINVTSNATEGYRVLKYAPQQMLSSNGVAIPSILSTNLAPASWSSACEPSAIGCIGYHTTDATLAGGSARFGASDTYAGLQDIPQEIMYSSIPESGQADIVFRLRVSELQPAGDYLTNIVYLAVPVH